MLVGLIDGGQQIIIIDLSPRVTRKLAVNWCQRWPWRLGGANHLIQSDESTPRCILLAMKALALWCRSVEGFFSRPLIVLHDLEPTERQEIYWRRKRIETTRVVFWSTTVAHIYSPRKREDRFQWRCEIEIRNRNGSTLWKFREWFMETQRVQTYCFP